MNENMILTIFMYEIRNCKPADVNGMQLTIWSKSGSMLLEYQLFIGTK